MGAAPLEHDLTAPKLELSADTGSLAETSGDGAGLQIESNVVASADPACTNESLPCQLNASATDPQSQELTASRLTPRRWLTVLSPRL